jgi:integrase
VTEYAARYRTREALAYLADFHRAPRLSHLVRKISRPRPRNVTATADEIRAVLDACEGNRGLKLLVLLCSDEAIRSGTACRLGWQHYHPEWNALIFSTKWQEKLTLPVTEEVAELLRQTNSRDERPFVTQLWTHDRYMTKTTIDPATVTRHFQQAREAAGVRYFRLHDLRRTTAVRVFRKTRDLNVVRSVLGHRDLASTVYYLDHDLVEVPRLLLEAVKPPRKEKTA